MFRFLPYNEHECSNLYYLQEALAGPLVHQQEDEGGHLSQVDHVRQEGQVRGSSGGSNNQ